MAKWDCSMTESNRAKVKSCISQSGFCTHGMSLQGLGQPCLIALLVTGPVASLLSQLHLLPVLVDIRFSWHLSCSHFLCLFHVTLTASYIVFLVFAFRDFDPVKHAGVSRFSLKYDWMLYDPIIVEFCIAVKPATHDRFQCLPA